MAIKIARECCGSGPDCTRLADLVAKLHAIVMSHLDYEERTLAHLSSDGHDERVTDYLAELFAQHVQVRGLLEEVCQAAGLPQRPDEDACLTVQAFYEELSELDRYLRAQLATEDGMLAQRTGRASACWRGPAHSLTRFGD